MKYATHPQRVSGESLGVRWAAMSLTWRSGPSTQAIAVACDCLTPDSIGFTGWPVARATSTGESQHCNVTMYRLVFESMGRNAIHGEATRKALLQAALSLAADGGLEAVTARGVADRAGTTTRALYRLFGSHQGLMDNIAADAADELLACLMRVPISGNPRDDLVRLGTEGFRAFAMEKPHLFDALLRSSDPRSGLFAPRVLDFVGARVRRAGLRGRAADPPWFVPYQYVAVCVGLVISPFPADSALEAETLWTGTLNALVSGQGSE